MNSPQHIGDEAVPKTIGISELIDAEKSQGGFVNKQSHDDRIGMDENTQW